MKITSKINRTNNAVSLTIVIVLSLLINSCSIQQIGSIQQEKRLARSSAQIDEVKSLIQDFQERNWTSWATHYTTQAAIYHNTWDASSSVNETKKSLQAMLSTAKSYLFKKPLIFENARDDSGKITGVHFWAVLSIKRDNNTIDLPMHLSFHIKKGLSLIHI